MSTPRYTSRFASNPQTESPASGSATSSLMERAPSSDDRPALNSDAGNGLDEEVSLARQKRLSRQSTRSKSTTISSFDLEAARAASPLPTQTAPTSPNNVDQRDTASARQNILSLASSGRTGGTDGAAPSLASFMGGGIKAPRLGKVGTGPTIDEQEVTERLGREMEASKARWADKARPESPVKGLSLANLMKGTSEGSSSTGGTPVVISVIERVRPSDLSTQSSSPLESMDTTRSSTTEIPKKLESSTSSRQPFVASPSSSISIPIESNTPINAQTSNNILSEPIPARSSTFPSTSTTSMSSPAKSLSLAAMLGSKATGPRLNFPAPAPPVEEGPAHARSGFVGVAMPGMVAAGGARSRSRSFGRKGEVNTEGSGGGAVEAKVIERVAPTPSIPAEPVRATSSSSRSVSPTASAKIFSTTSATRLPASTLVADRIKIAEEVGSVPKEASVLESPKRRSVMERWGRDEPNSPGGSLSNLNRPKSLQPVSRSSALQSAVQPSSPTLPTSTSFPSSLSDRSLASRLNKMEVSSSTSSGRNQQDVVMREPSPPGTNSGRSATGSARGTSKASTQSVMESPATFSKPSYSNTVPFPTSASASTSQGKASTRPMSFSGPSTPTPTPAVSRVRPISVSTSQRSRRHDSEDIVPRTPGGSSVRSAIAAWGHAKSNSVDPSASSSIKESYGIGMGGSRRPASRKTSFDTAPWESKGKVNSSSSSIQNSPTPTATVTTKRAADSSFSTSPRATKTATLAPTFEKMQDKAGSKSGEGDRTRKVEPLKYATKNRGLSERELLKLVGSASRTSQQEVKETTARNLFVISDGTALQVKELNLGGAFYEDERIVIIHSFDSGRKKNCEMLIWSGKEAGELGDKDRATIEELRRDSGYVDVVEVKQGREAEELIEVLGGNLVIRRGTRHAFEEADARLYAVQACGPGIVISEDLLSCSCVCSAYCYVISLMGEVYVWIGRGSVGVERHGAYSYAEDIANGRETVVVIEGEEPAHFWHVLDGNEYASAHYWRFRPKTFYQPTLLAVDSTSPSSAACITLASEIPYSSMSILDAGFEIWILVPATVKDNRDDLELALASSDQLAHSWKERQFKCRPAIHVLSFPTLLPRDLKHLTRKLDFDMLNKGSIPSRMNIQTAEEAKKSFIAS